MTAMVQAQVPMVNATRFRQAHEADWEELDRIVTAIEKRGVRGVPEQALLVLPVLYRSALSSLSVARETSLDKSLVAYLEQLCTRAYFQIYGVPTSAMRQLGHFFAHSWPKAVQALWRETLVAFVLTAAGAIVAYLLVANNPSWYYVLMPEGSAQGRDPTASVQFLKDTIYGSGGRRQPTERAGVFRDVPVHAQRADRDHVVRAGVRAVPADRRADRVQRADAGRDGPGVRRQGARL